ncbi:MAG: sensor histidine kinase [Chloroflexota bacterium]
MRRRSWLVPATIVACLVEIVIGLAFVAGRQFLASDPVRFDSWNWATRWTADAVGVSAVPGAVSVRSQGISFSEYQGMPVSWLTGFRDLSFEEAADGWFGTGARHLMRTEGPISYVSWCGCIMDGNQEFDYEAYLRAETSSSRQPVLDTLASVGVWLAVIIGTTAIALVAWLLRPNEGWRCAWLVGMTAITSCSVIWELGLRPTDLVRKEPMLPLFMLTGPMALVFWSSIAQVLMNLPARADPILRRRWLLMALYLVPQAALVVGLAVSRLVSPTTLEWIGSWATVLGTVVLGLGVVAAIAARRLHQRTTSRPRWLPVLLAAPAVLCAFLVPSLGPRVSLALCVMVAVTVLVAPSGRPSLPRLGVLVAGAALSSLILVAPNDLGAERILPTTIGAVGLSAIPRLPSLPETYPWALLLLAIGVIRFRVYDLDVYQEARRRAVVGRETERRRLRRDIHDGLGPMLASMTLTLDLAQEQVRSDPEAAEAAIEQVKQDARSAVTEVRRLVRDLRPSALDDLGLVDALRQRIDDLGRTVAAVGTGPDIEVAAEPLPPLDAATEVAAYRIVLEAVHNVLRHAAAAHCRVRISTSDTLDIEVADDGIELAPDAPAGVGVVAMRERAAEVGGSFRLDRSSDGWTRVTASLPIGSM